MQQRPENDLVHVLTVLEATGKIKIYANGFADAYDFFQSDNQLYFNASLLLLATVGDHVSKTSEFTKSKYQYIHWKRIKGLRNRIVHELQAGSLL